ncbi:hypothetical protein F8M41_004560 [Gigaspora margarita]|uniref:Uncharacterized protein n=1 Tax=Gigaspora margarita TaxID=4874 RepID=A0A8H3XAA9_GIGMA|nr:hypothetical protein F8M41_004560 [Gigaspora margarita]
METNSRVIKERYTNKLENQLAIRLKLNRVSEKKSKKKWIIYEKKKSQDLVIGQIKRKMETKARIEIWASRDKENIELEFRKARKKRKEGLEDEQKVGATQEKKALTDISKWINRIQDISSIFLLAKHLIDSWLGSS